MTDISPEPLRQWACQQLAERSVEVTGEIDVRARHWSIVMRIPTTAGLMWAKLNGPCFGYEVAIIEVLTKVAADLSLTPLAIDIDHGWLLLPDGGPTLADGGDAMRHLNFWCAIAAHYATLQRRCIERSGELGRRGVPLACDARLLDVIPAAISQGQRAEFHDHRITGTEVSLIEQQIPRLRSVISQLIEQPIPPVLEHNDPHPNNVFSDYRFFDWGDSAVTFPAVGLWTIRRDAARFLPAQRHAELDAVETAYLQVFADYASLPQLRQIAALAAQIAPLVRLGPWLRLPAALCAEYPEEFTGYLRALIPADSH